MQQLEAKMRWRVRAAQVTVKIIRSNSAMVKKFVATMFVMLEVDVAMHLMGLALEHRVWTNCFGAPGEATGRKPALEKTGRSVTCNSCCAHVARALTHGEHGVHNTDAIAVTSRGSGAVDCELQKRHLLV
jgi:hypothetical protein